MNLKRVLLADDSRVFRILMADILREQGLEVLEAATGRDALELILSQRPQLLLLDGLLPLMSGFDVAKNVREKSPDYNPVIFLVTGVYKSRSYEAEARRQYQVDEYLQKPLEPEDLLAAIGRHFPAFAGSPKKA